MLNRHRRSRNGDPARQQESLNRRGRSESRGEDVAVIAAEVEPGRLNGTEIEAKIHTGMPEQAPICPRPSGQRHEGQRVGTAHHMQHKATSVAGLARSEDGRQRIARIRANGDFPIGSEPDRGQEGDENADQQKNRPPARSGDP